MLLDLLRCRIEVFKTEKDCGVTCDISYHHAPDASFLLARCLQQA